MTRYRKTMAEAWNESILIESGLMGTIKPDQLDNIKKVWAKKTMKDVTPGVRAMLAKLDMPTKVAVKHANINVLSKLVLDEKELEEQTELDEGRMKDIFTADQEGQSAEEIAKKLKLSLKTVKDILGESEQIAIDEGGVKAALMDVEDDATRMDLNKFIRKHYGTMGLTAQELKKIFYRVNNEETELQEVANFTASMLNILKKEYEPMRGKKITAARAKQLMNILDKLNDKNLETLSKANIPFVSSGSASKLAVRKMKFKVTNVNPFKEEVESIDEKIDPFMLSYSDRYGKHAGFEGAKTLQDLQNKAANLRKKGFKIDKMGRYNPPIKEDIQNEACWVGYKQVGMKNKGGKQVPNCVPEDKELEEHIEESTAAKEIARTNTRKDSMDYAMYNKSIDLLKSKKYDELKKFLKKSDTAPREYVMSTIAKKEPATFKKMYGNQTGYYSLMNQKEAFAVQVTKKDGGKFIHGTYKTKAEAEKFVKWYKTGDLRTTKKIEVVKEMAKDDAYAIGMAAAKKHTGDTEPPLEKTTIKKGHEIAKKILKKEDLDESTEAVRKKADKSGMPYSILKKVYDRGMAAWKGGHRPGATQVQWALARVNSFVTKSSGTWGGADKDLAKQVRSEDLDAVPQDKDVAKKDGTQPKKYYKGLSKSDKDKRADYFKNNKSNKPAPGDKDAKTKPSIHTNKFKKMYGEGANQLVDRIIREKMEKKNELFKN